jgi:hypothetical protein
MALLDAPARALAKQLLSKFGGDATLVTVHSSNKNFRAGTAAATEVEYAVKFLPTEDKESRRESGGNSREIEGVMAAQGLTVDPNAQNARLRFDGVDREIVSAERLWSGGQKALWTLRLEA